MNNKAIIKPDAKELLLNAAEKLFADYGFDGTSIRMIASVAGLNIALINYYFGSKKALLIQIFKTRLQQLNANLQHIPQLDVIVPEKLTEFLDVYSAMFSNNNFQRLLHREITFLDVSPVNDLITNYLNNNLLILDELINEGIKKGYFKDTSAHSVYLTIFGMLPFMIVGSPISNIISKTIDPKGTDFSQDKIKDYLYHLLKRYQTEFIYKS